MNNQRLDDQPSVRSSLNRHSVTRRRSSSPNSTSTYGHRSCAEPTWHDRPVEYTGGCSRRAHVHRPRLVHAEPSLRPRQSYRLQFEQRHEHVARLEPPDARAHFATRTERHDRPRRCRDGPRVHRDQARLGSKRPQRVDVHAEEVPRPPGYEPPPRRRRRKPSKAWPRSTHRDGAPGRRRRRLIAPPSAFGVRRLGRRNPAPAGSVGGSRSTPTYRSRLCDRLAPRRYRPTTAIERHVEQVVRPQRSAGSAGSEAIRGPAGASVQPMQRPSPVRRSALREESRNGHSHDLDSPRLSARPQYELAHASTSRCTVSPIRS